MTTRKISAVEELADKILKLESLNGRENGLSANAERIQGGLSANKVADEAEMDFEVRRWKARDHARWKRNILEKWSTGAPACVTSATAQKILVGGGPLRSRTAPSAALRQSA